MTDLKIQPYSVNGDWDLVIENNDFVMVGGTAETWQDALKQRLVYRLLTWYGESAFDRNAGFPYQEAVFGKHPIDGISELIYDVISTTDGVDSIEETPEIQLDTETRRLSISVVVRAGEFVVPIEVTVGGTA